MAGYTDPFGGSAINPAQTAYRAVTLSANTTLSWPSVATDENYVARSMRVNATGAGLSLTMPDATAVSPGFDVVFTNTSANTYTVRDNAGTAICTVASGQSQYVQLTSNATVAGTWWTLQFGASSSTATAAALAGAGLQVDPSDANRLSPKRTVLAFTDAARVLTTSTDLGAVLDWTSGTATWSPGAGSSAAAMGLGFFFGLRNSGTGTLSFDGGGSQIDDATTLTLQPGESCDIISNGSEWRTIGRGRSNTFAFTRLSKAVNPSGAFSLTATECANNIHRYTGALTGAVTVTYQPVVQIYFVQNATTSASSFTVTLTTGSGTSQALSPGQSMVVVCDGTNMIDATTVIVGGFSNGSAAAPSVFFTSDTDTGVYRVASNQLGFSTGGVQAGNFDSGQRLLLGPTTSRTVGGTARKVQLEAASADIGLSVVRNSNDTTGPGLHFGKSRATALNGVTVATTGDSLGDVTWSAADGVAMTDAGSRIWASYLGAAGASTLNVRGGGLMELKASSTANAYHRVYDNIAGFSPLAPDPAGYSGGSGTMFFAGGNSTDPCGYQTDNIGAGVAGYFLSGITQNGLDDGGTYGVRLKGQSGVSVAVTPAATEVAFFSTVGLGVGAAPVNRPVELHNSTRAILRTQSTLTTGTDALGGLEMYAWDGAAVTVGATIYYSYSLQSSDPNTLTLNNTRAAGIVFKTSNTEAARFDSSQRLLVGATTATGDAKIQVTNGVRFGGTTSTDANTLDFYAEGTFTPTAIGSTTAGTGTYTTQEGTFTRIGNRVFFSIHLAWTAHTGTGNLRLGTLPYTAGGAGPVNPPCSVWSSDLTFSGQLTAMVVNATQLVYVRSIASGVAFSEVALDTAATIYVSGCYNV